MDSRLVISRQVALVVLADESPLNDGVDAESRACAWYVKGMWNFDFLMVYCSKCWCVSFNLVSGHNTVIIVCNGCRRHFHLTLTSRDIAWHPIVNDGDLISLSRDRQIGLSCPGISEFLYQEGNLLASG